MPSAHTPRILLAVTGLSPQVVTETLYALAIAGEPRFVPDEIHLVTTAEGARRARLALLSDEPGWFHRLCADYALPAIRFTPEQIHVVEDARGLPLEDIRSIDDNRCAADAIVALVRRLTADPASALHVSIAGGRKSMGFFLGYALSLFGRPQDRLSHVLVSEPFESSWDFFYPSPTARIIPIRNAALADARDAVVTLADIPFVSLRHGLPKALLDGQAGYVETVATARQRLGPPTLRLDLATCRIEAAGRSARLPRAQFALYSLFARHARASLPPLPAPGKHVPDPEWAARYLKAFESVAGPLADLEKTRTALSQGMDGDYFSSCLSKLQASLRRLLGELAAPYLIEDGNQRPRRYRLGLPAQAIEIVDAHRNSPHKDPTS